MKRAALGVLLIAAACADSGNQAVQADGGSGSAAPSRSTLSLTVNGSGEILSSSPSFSCRDSCEESLDAASAVQLSAIPDAGFVFSGWSGACSGSGACSVSMSANESVTATFAAAPPPPAGSYVLNIVFVGDGSGAVISSPAGIQCPGACAMTVSAGTLVSLSATADASSTFSGFGGGCSGTSCSVTVSANTTVWADFAANAPAPPPTPPAPPPAPPAECASIAPAAPGSPVSTTIYTGSGCAPGLVNGSGVAGLQALSNPGVLMHFMDEHSGAQNGTSSGNYVDFTGSFTQQRDGFTGVFRGSGDTYTIDYWDRFGFNHSGGNLEGQIAFTGMPAGGVLLAGNFASPGTPGTPRVSMYDESAFLSWGQNLASPGTVFGLGGDVSNHALVISDGGGGNIDAQWFAGDGTILTGAFRLLSNFQAGANTWFMTAPLIGGGVAVRRVDGQTDASGRPYTTSQWLVTLQAGSTTPQAAPAWLTQRANTDLAIARGGHAYAVLPLGGPNLSCAQSVEILAADGVSCGSFDAGIASGTCRTEDLALGLDGTPIQLLPRALSGANACAYRWWPAALQ